MFQIRISEYRIRSVNYVRFTKEKYLFLFFWKPLYKFYPILFLYSIHSGFLPNLNIQPLDTDLTIKVSVFILFQI